MDRHTILNKNAFVQYIFTLQDIFQEPILIDIILISPVKAAFVLVQITNSLYNMTMQLHGNRFIVIFQMIWAGSSHLGCGYALCNGTRHFYVCNYGPT